MAKPMSTTSEQHDGTPQLLRPRFFPGQLLTDRNLTDIIGWVKSRFLLTRGENAWGIVCGMSVSKGKKESTCEVSAGVAVDAAGNPIAFQDSDPAAWKTIELPLVASIDRDNCTNIHAGSATNDKYTIGPYENVTAKKWAVFDLSVCAKDRDEDPVPTPCGKDRKCQETRTRESGELHLTRVKWSDLTRSPNTQPQSDQARELLAAFENLDKDTFGATAESRPNVRDIRKWFTAKWNADPQLLRAYPGLPEVTEKNPDTWFANPANVAKLLTWLTDSLRRSAEPCDFPTASCPANAVPLARIWAEAVGNYYHVRVIEDVSPLRREFGSDIEARLDPRRYLGRNVHEVIAELGRLGIPAKGEASEIPGTGKALQSIYKTESDEIGSGFKPGEPVVVLYWKTAADKPSAFVNRVFAFRKGAANEGELTTGGSLKVRLFVPTPDMELGVKYDTMPPTDEELPTDLVALPAGGKIRLAVDLENFKFYTGKRVFKFKYFDELTRKIVELEPTASEKAIIASTQLPDTDRENLSVTLLVEEQMVSESVPSAISGKLSVPIVRALVQGDTVAKITSVNDNVGTQTAVVRLIGKDSRLPLQLTLKNVLTKATIPLRLLDTIAPASPTTPPSHEANVIVTRNVNRNLATGEFVIPMPISGVTNLYYWVSQGDELGRKFDAPQTKTENGLSTFAKPVPNFAITDLKLTVEIQPTEPNKAKLILKNDTGSNIKITDGSVQQLSTGGIETSAGNPTIVAGTPATTPNLHRVNDTDYWRVKLEYMLGNDPQRFFAAIDVKAT